jgi:hypothetical protein
MHGPELPEATEPQPVTEPIPAEWRAAADDIVAFYNGDKAGISQMIFELGRQFDFTDLEMPGRLINDAISAYQAEMPKPLPELPPTELPNRDPRPEELAAARDVVRIFGGNPIMRHEMVRTLIGRPDGPLSWDVGFKAIHAALAETQPPET